MASLCRVAVVSAGLWVAFLVHSGADGAASMPCEGSLIAWCWTRDVLGYGPAWLLLHGFVSLAIGWAFVLLPQHGRTRRIAPKRWAGVERRRTARSPW